MPLVTSEQGQELGPFLLPFDARMVGALGTFCLSVRCTEDRPTATPFSEPVGKFDISKWPLFGDANSMVGPTVEREIPNRPSDEESHTPYGMMINAFRTGISVTGGQFNLGLAQSLSHIIEGINPDSLPPLNKLSSILNQLDPWLGYNHGHCLGRAGAATILRFAVDNPDLTLQTSLDIAPAVNQDTFEPFLDAAEQMLDRPEFFPSESDPAPTPLRPLIYLDDDPENVVAHAAKRVVAIHNTTGDNVLWDTTAAWPDKPGYALNIGFLPHVMRRTTRSIGGNPEAAENSLIFFQGAAIHKLPRPDGEPLQVVRVDDAESMAA